VSTAAIQPATINRRFVAFMLDGLALGIVAVLVVGNIAFAGDTSTGAFARVAIFSLVELGYFVLTWTQLGASPFQWLLGIRTLNAADGALVTPSQAVRRWAILYGPNWLLSALALLPGAGSAGLLVVVYWYYPYRTASRDPQRRGFHDHQSGTIVVGASTRPVPPS
jgi:hypothetical protein